jgi:hypothetical protein
VVSESPSLHLVSEAAIQRGRIDQPLDPERLYDDPIGNQIEIYLSLPWTKIAALLPGWGLRVDVEPSEQAIHALPYRVDELAVVIARVRPTAICLRNHLPIAPSLDSN